MPTELPGQRSFKLNNSNFLRRLILRRPYSDGWVLNTTAFAILLPSVCYNRDKQHCTFSYCMCQCNLEQVTDCFFSPCCLCVACSAVSNSVIHCGYKRRESLSFHTRTFSDRAWVQHNGDGGTLQPPYAPDRGGRNSDDDDLAIKLIDKLYRVVLQRVLKMLISECT
jgi:hypothetical protein